MTLTPQELRALFIAVFDEFHDGPFLDKESSVKRLTHTFNFELHGHCEGAAATTLVGVEALHRITEEEQRLIAENLNLKTQLGRIEAAAADFAIPFNSLDELASTFLTWPLPETVTADMCATVKFYPNRTGTNLLSFGEAREMLRHVLKDHLAWVAKLVGFWKTEEFDWKSREIDLENQLKDLQAQLTVTIAGAEADHAANLAYNEQVTKLQVVNTDLNNKLREWETGSCSREVAAGVVEELMGYLHHETDCESLAPGSGSCSCGIDEIIKKHRR